MQFFELARVLLKRGFVETSVITGVKNVHFFSSPTGVRVRVDCILGVVRKAIAYNGLCVCDLLNEESLPAAS